MVLKQLEKQDKINEAAEVVGMYEFCIVDLEPTLKVKVIQTTDNKYMGLANLEVLGKGKASPYRSLSLKRTKKEAVRDAVQGFLVFYSCDAKVLPVKDW